jgi:hypothetical protein
MFQTWRGGRNSARRGAEWQQAAGAGRGGDGRAHGARPDVHPLPERRRPGRHGRAARTAAWPPPPGRGTGAPPGCRPEGRASGTPARDIPAGAAVIPPFSLRPPGRAPGMPLPRHALPGLAPGEGIPHAFPSRTGLQAGASPPLPAGLCPAPRLSLQCGVAGLVSPSGFPAPTPLMPGLALAPSPVSRGPPVPFPITPPPRSFEILLSYRLPSVQDRRRRPPLACGPRGLHEALHVSRPLSWNAMCMARRVSLSRIPSAGSFRETGGQAGPPQGCAAPAACLRGSCRVDLRPSLPEYDPGRTVRRKRAERPRAGAGTGRRLSPGVRRPPPFPAPACDGRLPPQAEAGRPPRAVPDRERAGLSRCPPAWAASDGSRRCPETPRTRPGAGKGAKRRPERKPRPADGQPGPAPGGSRPPGPECACKTHGGFRAAIPLPGIRANPEADDGG